MQEMKDLLSCWHRIEYFTPAVLPQKCNCNTDGAPHGINLNCVMPLYDQCPCPWDTPQEIASGKVREYIIYVGIVPYSSVIKRTLEMFKDSTEVVNPQSSLLCSASLRVTSDGFFIRKSFGLSSLPFALVKLHKNMLSQDDWATLFKTVHMEVFAKIENLLNEKQSVRSLQTITQIITTYFDYGLPPERYNSFFRVEEHDIIKKNNNDDTVTNVDIINSFYVEDLERIVNTFDAISHGSAFGSYLKGCYEKYGERIDLSCEINELELTLAPEDYPDGCWPSSYTLNLMQQYAVTKIFNEFDRNGKGLLSINGPPGTGKTTLLRDLIAANIVARAKLLSVVSEPEKQFSKLGELQTDSGFAPWIYSLAAPLCATGMVVASSNNGAVENISMELPLIKEIHPYESELHYFQEVAGSCFGSDRWGVFAAVMGNRDKRTRLTKDLWGAFKKEVVTLSSYLKTTTVTLTEWQQAVKDFDAVLNEVHQEKARLQQIRSDYNTLIQLQNEIHVARTQYEELKDVYINSKKAFEKTEVHLATALIKKENAFAAVQSVQKLKPGFFSLLFNRQLRISYKQSHLLAWKSFNEAQETYYSLEKIYQEQKTSYDRIVMQIQELEKTITRSTHEVTEKESLLSAARDELQTNFADVSYWQNLDEKVVQDSCPWFSKKLKELQSRLFIQAVHLHEKFILAANSSKAQRVTTTLNAFFNYLNGEYVKKPSPEEIQAMWDVFFLVIPVVSTTFASVQSMFQDMPHESLPWLFIDEAGQAIPQAAAGSIWRAMRVVVVGDPLQIEPVVTIPSIVANNISKYFNLSENVVYAELSVQSMADRINPYGMMVQVEEEAPRLWIGTPLRVHRRCLDPMFSIANNIAYSNNMVLCTSQPKEISVHFKNAFIDQKGKVEGRHWVPAQGEAIVRILKSEIHSLKNMPNIFVISPFSEVCIKLRTLLRKELHGVIELYDSRAKDTITTWIKNNIGTVHTFQGKQAEGVIFCLGLDEATKRGAQWASKKPNLLNVALTRAKYRFIAIGDAAIWLDVKYFCELRQLGVKDE